MSLLSVHIFHPSFLYFATDVKSQNCSIKKLIDTLRLIPTRFEGKNSAPLFAFTLSPLDYTQDNTFNFMRGISQSTYVH